MIAVSLPPPVQADMARIVDLSNAALADRVQALSIAELDALDAIDEALEAWITEQLRERDQCGLDPLDSEMQANAQIISKVMAARLELEMLIDALEAHAEEGV